MTVSDDFDYVSDCDLRWLDFFRFGTKLAYFRNTDINGSLKSNKYVIELQLILIKSGPHGLSLTCFLDFNGSGLHGQKPWSLVKNDPGILVQTDNNGGLSIY